ncbi:hypothetical protein JCM11251_000664 [Rhodosporidiobolus azoricus]
MIPTAADRATNNGEAPVVVGSHGATNQGSGASGNAIESYDNVNETGGRAAGSNQQVPEGTFSKQVKESEKVTDAPVAQQ